MIAEFDVFVKSWQGKIKLEQINIQNQSNLSFSFNCSNIEFDELVFKENNYSGSNSIESIFDIILCQNHRFQAKNIHFTNNTIVNKNLIKFSGEEGEIIFNETFIFQNNYLNSSMVLKLLSLFNCKVELRNSYQIVGNKFESSYFLFFSDIKVKEKILMWNNFSCAQNSIRAFNKSKRNF